MTVLQAISATKVARRAAGTVPGVPDTAGPHGPATGSDAPAFPDNWF
jgi:hypothetical protein